MRRPLLVAVVVLSGCWKLQGIPTNHQLEATFPASVQTTDLPGQFKVATFNIHMEPGHKVATALLADRALRDVDVIALEEVPRENGSTCSSACAMGHELGMYSVFAPAHSKDGDDFGVAILSRVPITSARVIELPWNDVHFNAGRRIALVATVQHEGRPITVYAVHLENRLTASDRKRQMKPVLVDASQQRTPVIIAGDFNTNPFTWISHWIPLPTGAHQQHALESFVRSYGFDTPVAGSGATHRYIGMKLDAIYTRGFDTKHFAVAHAKDVSDHMALWAIVAPTPQPPTVAAAK
ncbi:MAG TPA: endonuclease/exonuclease/phosphatase family protein [Kofleriaceae bacterium]|nr:endonuclease/exonuclease/phosphatase family protein [Kofleriaceae bacterium]